MESIIILGAGNIGSRHLQGLSNLAFPADIFVVDPKKKSRSLSKKRWNDISCNKHSVSYYESVENIGQSEITVCIIATPASVRKHAFEDLIHHCSVESIIFEKFLFQTEKDYYEVENSLERRNIDAWVNCPRRNYDLYKNIKRSISEDQIKMSVCGANWGIGCNGIHYADLFGWLTESKRINWNNSLLQERILEAKRDGFVEFAGTLFGTDTNNNSIILSSFEANDSYVTVRISTPSQQWIIDPIAKHKKNIIKRKNDWVSEQTSVEIPYISELIGRIVTNIVQQNECDLPTFTESKEYHLPLLQTLRQHIEMVRDEEIKECPIT